MTFQNVLFHQNVVRASTPLEQFEEYASNFHNHALDTEKDWNELFLDVFKILEVLPAILEDEVYREQFLNCIVGIKERSWEKLIEFYEAECESTFLKQLAMTFYNYLSEYFPGITI